MRIKDLALAVACLFGAVSGDHITKLGRKTAPPTVQSCDKLCVFKDATNSWCFETTPPVLRAGWEWNQVYGETDKKETKQDPVKYY